MKVGLCIGMIATKEDTIGWEWSQALTDIGYDYLEAPLAQLMALPEHAFAAIKNHLEKVGLPCEGCNNFFPGHLPLTGPAVDLPAILRYAEQALARAAQLGAQFVVFGSGKAKQVPEGFPKQKAWQQLVVMLRGIAPLAEQHGITIVIEPLRTAECNIINTYKEAAELAKTVNREQVQVLVDYYHMTQENEPLSHISEGGGSILRHVHFAHPEGRVFPTLAAVCGYKPFFSTLQQAGYDGRISVEAFSEQPAQELNDALASIKAAWLP